MLSPIFLALSLLGAEIRAAVSSTHPFLRNHIKGPISDTGTAFLDRPSPHARGEPGYYNKPKCPRCLVSCGSLSSFIIQHLAPPFSPLPHEGPVHTHRLPSGTRLACPAGDASSTIFCQPSGVDARNGSLLISRNGSFTTMSKNWYAMYSFWPG
jgi:hypothetical protein